MTHLTDAQKKFFKDTKAIDRSGQPLILYHGSKSKGFDAFEYSPTRQTGTDFGEAYYFTDDRRSAETYAYDQSKDDRMKRWLEQKDLIVEAFAGRPGCCEEIERLKVDGKTYNELLCDADYTKTGGEVHEVYLNMKKPLIVDAECRDYYKVYPEYFKEAKARGCDGVIVRSVNDTATGTPKITNVYIVFKPEQIKSVDNLYPTPSKEFRDNSLEYLKITKDMTFAERKEVSLHAAQILREAAKKNLHRAINEQDRGHISLYSSLVCAFIMLKLFLFY